MASGPDDDTGQPRRWRWSLAGLVLALFHTLVTAGLWSRQYEGSWGAFPLVVIDFPASLIFPPLVTLVPAPWLVYGVVGGLWWYALGHGVARVVARSRGPGRIDR